VELPSSINFDPSPDPDANLQGYNYREGEFDEFMAKKGGIIKMFRVMLSKDSDLRLLMKKAAAHNGRTFNEFASSVIAQWATNIQHTLSDGLFREHSTERVMDLKGVIVPLTSTWLSYGPWYSSSITSSGVARIDIDPSLVPWNFPRPPAVSGWAAHLNSAGNEKLQRSIADVYKLDNAVISVAGFPEYGPAQSLGYNSNLTGISVDFGIGVIKTTYSWSTYLKKPGTFRKSEFDNVSAARVDTREKLPDPINTNVIDDFTKGQYGYNKFIY
jgi:hypothetical protein